MSKIFKRSYLAYGNLIAALLCLVVAILGPITKGFAAHTFAPFALVLLIVAVLVSLASFFLDQSYLPLISALIVAFAFGIVIYYSLPIFADKFNNLNFQNGEFSAVLLYSILSGIALLFSIIPSFDNKK